MKQKFDGIDDAYKEIRAYSVDIEIAVEKLVWINMPSQEKQKLESDISAILRDMEGLTSKLQHKARIYRELANKDPDAGDK